MWSPEKIIDGLLQIIEYITASNPDDKEYYTDVLEYAIESIRYAKWIEENLDPERQQGNP